MPAGNIECCASPYHTVEGVLTKENGKAPAIVLSELQARLVFRGKETGRDISGIPIAKPWQTEYRGELFIYIPEKKIDVPIELPPWEFDEKPVNKGGIVGIGVLRKVELVDREERWGETFPEHREKGPLPFKPTYLWYLDRVRLFRQPLRIKMAGKWVGEEELPNYEVPADLENYILDPSRRQLHLISIFELLYMKL